MVPVHPEGVVHTCTQFFLKNTLGAGGGLLEPCVFFGRLVCAPAGGGGGDLFFLVSCFRCGCVSLALLDGALFFAAAFFGIDFGVGVDVDVDATVAAAASPTTATKAIPRLSNLVCGIVLCCFGCVRISTSKSCCFRMV